MIGRWGVERGNQARDALRPERDIQRVFFLDGVGNDDDKRGLLGSIE